MKVDFTMRRFCSLVAAICLLSRGPAAIADGEATDNIGMGDLTTPSLSPGHILRPSSMFMRSDPHPEGSLNLSVDIHWGNVWLYSPDEYMIDGEWFQLNTRLSYSLSDSTSIGLLAPVMVRSGGFADSPIEHFHKAFNLHNDRREQFPQNRIGIWTVNNAATQTLAKGSSWGVGDASAFVEKRWNGGRIIPAVILQGYASLPTGSADDLEGLGTWSAGVSALVLKRLWSSPVIAFGGVGYSYSPADTIAGIGVHPEQWSGLIGLEYEYSRSLSFIVQTLNTSPAAADFPPFSDSSHELSIGFRWRIVNDLVAEYGITENIAVFNNSADIGAHVSFGRKL